MQYKNAWLLFFSAAVQRKGTRCDNLWRLCEGSIDGWVLGTHMQASKVGRAPSYPRRTFACCPAALPGKRSYPLWSSHPDYILPVFRNHKPRPDGQDMFQAIMALPPINVRESAFLTWRALLSRYHTRKHTWHVEIQSSLASFFIWLVSLLIGYIVAIIRREGLSRCYVPP